MRVSSRRAYIWMNQAKEFYTPREFNNSRSSWIRTVSLHHSQIESQLPLNLPLISSSSRVSCELFCCKKKEIVQIVSGPGAGPFVFSQPAGGEAGRAPAAAKADNRPRATGCARRRPAMRHRARWRPAAFPLLRGAAWHRVNDNFL